MHVVEATISSIYSVVHIGRKSLLGTGLVIDPVVPALWVQLGIEKNDKCCGAQYCILDIDLVYQVLSCLYIYEAFCSTQSEVGLVCWV
jgi:hypothetical protein